MTTQTSHPETGAEQRRTTLFRIDEPLHRPPDGYPHQDEWDPYAVNPEQIDDN